jgi:exodeoxyribonuclease VIII
MNRDIIKHGILGISNETYHASAHLGRSRLQTFASSPRKFQFLHLQGNDPGATPAMELGTLVHTLALEPHRFGYDYVVAPEINRHTKAGKEEWATLQASGKHVVQSDDLDVALNMANACRSRLGVMSCDPESYEPRVEVVFRGIMQGIPCQCRVDYISPQGICYDIKTTKDEPERWERGMIKAHWLQDIFYRSVIEAATGILPPPVRYLAVCKTAPHETIIRWIPDALTAFHREKLADLLTRFLACQMTNDWPEYDQGEAEAPIPGWLAAQAGIDELASMFSDPETDEMESV